MVHCLSGKRDFRQVWGCSKIRSKWNANLGRTPIFTYELLLYHHFHPLQLLECSGLRRVRAPNSEGETGITFGILSPSSPLLLARKKKRIKQADMREFCFCSQDSEFIFVSGAWFKRKYLEARSLQCTSVLKDVLSSFIYIFFFFTAALEETPAKIVQFLRKCNSFP